MDFKDNKPIYLQIAALIAERIATKQWVEGERIPSVRDLGMELGVNPNTCMRAYEQLTRDDVIVNARGIGYSVCDGGRARVVEMSRTEFMEQNLGIDQIGVDGIYGDGHRLLEGAYTYLKAKRFANTFRVANNA